MSVSYSQLSNELELTHLGRGELLLLLHTGDLVAHGVLLQLLAMFTKLYGL
jgi:hypothetical protein